ncbi:MAG: hypothetical protein WAM21_12470, partial [Steroidobacteraceae bacterium]
SGLDPQTLSVPTRSPIDDHPLMQSRDGFAARADAKARDQGMDEARQGGQEQRKPKPQRMALVLQIGLPNGPWVLEK